jgi:hypothetical protein
MKDFRPVLWDRVLVTAITAFLLLFGVLWLVRLRYIPAENARVFTDPISAISSIRISPEEPFSLVTRDIVITNQASIEEIMTAIRLAKPCFFNHPATRWECFLVISNSTGESSVDVSDVPGQGTMVYTTAGRLRNDGLREILEKATGYKESVPAGQQ